MKKSFRIRTALREFEATIFRASLHSKNRLALSIACLATKAAGGTKSPKKLLQGGESLSFLKVGIRF